ncbi:MAG: hypothetical protein NPINA01_18870 [Nitrospinaceae bacterium]|nr:MAG: hypothetical protein NPINA01_18870 [Nitrospinaceae bacterium]
MAFSKFKITVFIVVLILSAVVFKLTYGYQKNLWEKEFINQAEKTTLTLKNKIEVNERILLNIVSFYGASEEVNREEFNAFVSPIFEKNKFIQALEWIPRVFDNQRIKFENQVKKEGFPNFQITERFKEGSITRADSRPEYYPVNFVEPFMGNEAVLGFDLASNPKRLETLIASRDSGKILATKKVRLVQEEKEQSGVLIFAPFYGSPKIPKTTEERREKISGFVLGVYRLGDMFNNIISPYLDKGMNLLVFEEKGMSGKNIIFGQHNANSFLELKKEIEFSGRNWTVVLQADASFGKGIDKSLPMISSAAIIFLSVFVFIILELNRSQTEKIESEVLLQAQDLTENKARLKEAVDPANDAMFTFDETGGIKSFNPAAERLFGYQPSEVLNRNFNTLMPEPYSSEHDQYLKDHIETGVSRFLGVGREAMGLRKDGSTFPLDIEISEKNVGKKKMFAGFVRHSKERKKAERGKRFSFFLAAGSVVLALAIFAIDLSLPLGIASGVPYVAVVLFGVWSTQKRFILISATLCTGLVMLGLYFSPPGGELWQVLVNRCLAVFAIWITAVLCIIEKNLNAKLVEAKSYLEARTNSVLDNIPDGIITIGETGSINTFNPAAERLFGYRSSEVLGRNVNMLMPDPYSSEHDQYLKNYIETGKSKVIGIGREVVGLRKDGSTFPVDLGISEMYMGEKRMFTGIVRNITERKKAEELSLRFGRILDNSFNEIFIFDADTLRFVQVNQGALQNIGYSMEELSQLTFVDISPSFYESDFAEFVFPLVTRKESVTVFETAYQRKDGSLYDVEIRLQLMHDENPPVYVAIIEDVTQRKEQTLKVEQLTHRNKLILESAGEGIFGLDLDGKTTFANPAAEIMLGYSEEELLGQLQHALIHHTRTDGSPYPRDDCHIYAAFKDGRVHCESEEVFWRKDGTPLPVEYVATPIKEHGKITGAVVTFRDVTEKKQEEQNNILRYELTKILAEAQTLDEGVVKILQTFVEHPAWDMAFYWYTDSDSNVLSSENGAYSNKLGLEAYKVFSDQTFIQKIEKGTGLPGRVWESKKPAWINDVVDDPNFPRSPWAAKIGIHTGFGFPVFSGERFWGVFEVFTIDKLNLDQDLIDHFNNMGSQIGQYMQRVESEFELAETMLMAEEAKHQAESANRAKSSFLANMSHEIRTPMNAILGYAQIMLRDDSLPENKKESVATIERSGHHLLTLINDILDISKIEAGHIELNPVDFNLNDLVQGLGVMFSTRCEEKHLGFWVEGLNTHSFNVNGDEGKLRQILINLLGNAVKFTDKGEITVNITCDEEDRYKFSVTDTGKGISPEGQVKIFEPFQQAEEGVEKGGTGLGLAIATKQVELMGGKLELESEEGQGSCFFFTLHLPRSEAEVLPLSECQSDKVIGLAPGFSVKALVVDDKDINRDVLSKLLKDIGVEVMEAENGKVALDKIALFDPDIIFMDMRMPVMGGKEAIQEIVKRYGKDRFKVVSITASAFAHQRKEYFKIGCHEFIAKPFRAGQIFECMAKLLGVEFEYKISNKDQEITKENVFSHSVDFSKFSIPEKLFMSFKDAVEEGNITQLEKQLARLHQLGEEGELLGSHLSKFVDSYNFDEVLSILEKVETCED